MKVLENQYGFKPPAPATPPKFAAPGLNAPSFFVAPVAPQYRMEQATQLIAKLLKTPHPNEAAQLEWQTFAGTLNPQEFVGLFKDGAHLEALIILVRNFEGGLEDALARLPRDLVRSKAQEIADLLADYSYVTYYHKPKISYNTASRSWPALWSRIDRPLRYDVKPDLAAHIAPAQWPALFASGYSRHDAEVTGCLLSALDAPALTALWPDFQHFFTDGHEAAPALVLGKYRLARERSPCYYSSSPDETLAKLEFLRKQGVNSPVTGLRKSLLNETGVPSLITMAAALLPPIQKGPPRLVQILPTCDLKFNDLWLDALVKQREIGRVIPAEYVQAIDIPGQAKCGLLVSGDRYGDMSEIADDFFEGPFREGSTRCADAPDDGSMWVEADVRIQSFPISDHGCEGGCTLRKVRDTQTGRHYLLNDGMRGPLCAQSWELPDTYEWQSNPKGSTLISSRDGALIDRLLREQCQELPESRGLVCRGLGTSGDNASEANADDEDIFVTLRKGGVVPIKRLVDRIGNERKGKYAAAISAHDHSQLRHLLAIGIPTAWTAAEIQALGTAKSQVEEKRRRIALLFANPGQLDRTLNDDRYGLPKSLLAWLPYQDWKPVLQVIGRSPDIWRDAAKSLRESAEEANRSDLACAIDRAQGFLCGGGISVD